MELTNLREIIADTLAVPPAEINEVSGPANILQWDSVAHLDIVLSLEAEYGISFSPEEMLDAISVGAIEDILRRKGVRFE
jgi:acyl carrier protein